LVDFTIPSERTAAHLQEVAVAAKPKFTRIPKTTALLEAGVPTEAIPTYCCLADFANNKSGLCWPKMETLAQILNRSVRTVQRHLHLLRELGLIEFVNRRRHKGKFSSYLYKICFIATTGHGRRMARGDPNIRRTRHTTNTPKSPSKDRLDGYWSFFGEAAPADKQELHDREQIEKRKEQAKRRSDGFEWLFK
jgi:DNA-binding transcriptional ArsR family regulator